MPFVWRLGQVKPMNRDPITRRMFLVLAIGAQLVLPGCSSDDQEGEVQVTREPQHAWKDQTDMLERARDVENQVLGEAQRRQNEIDQQAR